MGDMGRQSGLVISLTTRGEHLLWLVRVMGRFTNPVYLRQSSTHAIWALTTEKIQEKTNLEVAFNAFTPHLNPDRKLDDNEVGER